MYYRVTINELLALILCGLFLGAAAAAVGIALGLDLYLLPLVVAVVGACPFAGLGVLTWAILARGEEEPQGPHVLVKTVDELLGD